MVIIVPVLMLVIMVALSGNTGGRDYCYGCDWMALVIVLVMLNV